MFGTRLQSLPADSGSRLAGHSTTSMLVRNMAKYIFKQLAFTQACTPAWPILCCCAPKLNEDRATWPRILVQVLGVPCLQVFILRACRVFQKDLKTFCMHEHLEISHVEA